MTTYFPVLSVKNNSCVRLSKITFGGLTSVAQGLLHYFDTRRGQILLTLTTLPLDIYYHRETIQFRAAESTVG